MSNLLMAGGCLCGGVVCQLEFDNDQVLRKEIEMILDFEGSEPIRDFEQRESQSTCFLS
jgi:hypothetical protein